MKLPSSSKKHPQLLAKKLLKIREDLGLSQSEMVRKLRAGDEINRGKISEYERAQRLPPLHLLLAYARAGNTSVDNLIDDEVNL